MRSQEPVIALRRAIVADDHPIYCDGLAALLAEIAPMAGVSRAERFDTVISQAATDDPPGLFLLDLNFPGMVLPDSVMTLRKTYPRASVIIVSMSDDAATISRVMAAGVDGFISKSASPDQMRRAIIDVLAGEFVQIGGPSRLDDNADAATDLAKLTDRQRDVLHLLAQGQSNKDIARALGISHFTARVHVSAILKLLNVSTRAGAAAIGAKFGV
jgi:DNA-binding NarL/FixJ family response regulator